MSSDAYDLGAAAASRGEWESAVRFFQAAVCDSAESVGIWNDLGVALNQLRRYAEALDAFDRGLAGDPRNARLWINRAYCVASLERMDEAVHAARTAVDATDDVAIAVRAAGLFSRLNLFTDSADALQRAICQGAATAALWNNLGTDLCAAGRIVEGEAAYRKALGVDPNFQVAHSNLLFSAHLDQDLAPEYISDCHLAWGRTMNEAIGERFDFSAWNRSQNRVLRVGYLSSDLRRHSIIYFLANIFENHDAESILLNVFANVHGPDETTEGLRSGTERWFDVHALSARECAELIYRERIDILIEVGGHTSPKTLEVLARKPAPVQISYLAYPDTTGLASVDYVLTDSITDPPGMTEHLFSEKLLRLDPCLLCYHPPVDSPPICPRNLTGSSEVVFGCFAQRQKLSPRILSLWISILRRCPNSKIVLKAKAWGDPVLRGEILGYFGSNGIAPTRVQLAAHVAHMRTHLQFYNHIDIVLDTFPYSGTTTPCEALWMGVPVIALPGRTQVSRLCASILNACGLGEFVAAGDTDYIEKAVALAADRERIVALRTNLRSRVRESVLCDGPTFTRCLEGLLRQVWQVWADTARLTPRTMCID